MAPIPGTSIDQDHAPMPRRPRWPIVAGRIAFFAVMAGGAMLLADAFVRFLPAAARAVLALAIMAALAIAFVIGLGLIVVRGMRGAAETAGAVDAREIADEVAVELRSREDSLS